MQLLVVVLEQASYGLRGRLRASNVGTCKPAKRVSTAVCGMLNTPSAWSDENVETVLLQL